MTIEQYVSSSEDITSLDSNVYFSLVRHGQTLDWLLEFSGFCNKKAVKVHKGVNYFTDLLYDRAYLKGFRNVTVLCKVDRSPYYRCHVEHQYLVCSDDLQIVYGYIKTVKCAVDNKVLLQKQWSNKRALKGKEKDHEFIVLPAQAYREDSAIIKFQLHMWKFDDSTGLCENAFDECDSMALKCKLNDSGELEYYNNDSD